MNRYKWTMEIIVEEDDEAAAQSRIEELLEEAFVDPDGIFSHGEMTNEGQILEVLEPAPNEETEGG